MRRSTRYSLLLALALIGALIGAIVLRKTAPPEAARLLPESDAIVYVNLKPLRLATHFDRSPVTRAPEYQHFIDATGIVPEHDLDAAAFALHRMDNPNGPNGPVGYSEVFEGRFDGQRLSRYLESIATARETYAGHTIYTVVIADGDATRPLRIAQLGYDSIAASNMPTAEQIHSILDRHRSAASPFSGSSLLSARYRDVPLLASAWGIGHIGLPFSDRGYITVFGLQLPLPEDTTFVASLRYTGTLRLRIEEISNRGRCRTCCSEPLRTDRSFQVSPADQAPQSGRRSVARNDWLAPHGPAQGPRHPHGHPSHSTFATACEYHHGVLFRHPNY